MTVYPHVAAPLDLGHVVSAQSRDHGLDAHRPRGPARGFAEAGGVLRRARARRRRPDGHRWLRPELAGLAHAVRRPLTSRRRGRRKHRLVTDAVHAEGGKIALQILHAGRYGYHPFSVSASAHQGADQPVQAARAHRARQSSADRRLSSRCAALAREAGYDGVEIMGSRGLLHQPVPLRRAPTSAPTAWGGIAREPHAPAVEIVRRDARARSATTSSSSTASRCSTWSTAARPGTRSSRWRKADRSRRRVDHQHRHRLARGARAHDRHLRAARRVQLA